MAINKISYGDEVLLDISSVTVTEEVLVEGETALNNAGEEITGINPYEMHKTNETVADQGSLIALIAEALVGKTAAQDKGNTTGGTLGIKTGTVTLSVSYSMPAIQHGCGKLPYAVFMISENKEHYDVNRITGALWHRNSICTLFSGNGVKWLWGFAQQYDVENEAPTNNGLVVTESTFHCSPPAHFNGGTYHWTAIYEV